LLALIKIVKLSPVPQTGVKGQFIVYNYSSGIVILFSIVAACPAVDAGSLPCTASIWAAVTNIAVVI
jgi:hypothetical protein